MITAWLIRPRPTWFLLGTGLVIGIAYALTLFPVEMALGNGPFWDFPRGGAMGDDFADAFVGYLDFQTESWHWPLLRMAHIMPPAGTNLFWLDAVPWVSLTGKVLYQVTGIKVNLFGPYQFACFALPGALTAAVLVAFDERGILATLAGATLVVALPFHLAEAGHPPLCAQFVILLALALYGVSVRSRPMHHSALLWFTVLALTLLTNIYLFAMVGAIWAAHLAQLGLDGTKLRRLGIEATCTIAAIVAIMVVTGILNPDLRSAGSGGFGEFSLNLGSPFIPQKSGVIPPLADYLIGTRSQVYGYLGLGVIFALLVATVTSFRWWWRGGRRYPALLVVLLGCFLFALSYKITLGSHVLVQLPLPESVILALGAFRASGRFFWPVGYALVMLAVITISTRFRPDAAALVLAVACVLQLIDSTPMRTAIARAAAAPAPEIIDRRLAASLATGVHAFALFPSFGCVPAPEPPTADAIQKQYVLLRLAMELQLIAARQGVDINSVYNARVPTDCAAEATRRSRGLERGVLYAYLDGNLPDAAQFGGADPSAQCRDLGYRLLLCRLPDE